MIGISRCGLLFIFFITPYMSVANPCDDLEDKPALEIMRVLKERKLIGSGDASIENEFTLGEIYHTNKNATRRQLQYAFTLVRSIREREAKRLSQKFIRDLERKNQAALNALEEGQTFSPEKVSDGVRLEQVRLSDEMFAYDNLIMEQIARFKTQYFSPHFVNAINTDDSYTLDMIVAVALPKETNFPAKEFTIRLNVDGKPQDLAFSKDNLKNNTGTYPVVLKEIFEALHTSFRVPKETYNDNPIHFYRLFIDKR